MTTKKSVKRAYKYRFYPTDEQANVLARTFGCARLVYNKALDIRSRSWSQEKKRVSYEDTAKMLTEWKTQEDLAFLSEVANVPLQQSLRNLQNAFMNFWGKKGKYPKFKSKRDNRDSITYQKNGFTFRNGALQLAKTSTPLDIIWSRPLPKNAVPIKVTVSRDPSNRYHISILVDEEIEELKPKNTSVGVDMGINTLATLSTGEKIQGPRAARALEDKLALAQRRLAKKEKGSKNREKARLKVARIHAKIADQRRDSLHKITTRLVRENQTIIIEDLNARGMSASAKGTVEKPGRNVRQKAGLNKSNLDSSYGMFREMLEYKCDWYGRELVKIDRFYPSSKTCSACGKINSSLVLKDRSWECSECGATHDRDVNAARNIEAVGLAVLACGDGVRLR